MKREEFYKQFGLHFNNMLEEAYFIAALDKLYVEFTKDQALQIVSSFYDNADDIFNEFQEAAEAFKKETMAKLAQLFDTDLDSDEGEEDLDKPSEA